MEDYHFHCFHHGSRETEPFMKAGPQDNGNDDTEERDHHFLDACFRCGRLLGHNKDIFMYRGDTPFCSEGCRQQEMDADEARERSSKQQPAAAAAKSGRKQQRLPNLRRVAAWPRGCLADGDASCHTCRAASGGTVWTRAKHLFLWTPRIFGTCLTT